MRARRAVARLGAVRVRTTGSAVLIVAITLGVASWSMITLLRSSLINDVTTSASLRAEDVAQLLESGRTPSTLAVDGHDVALVQVVDSAGRVVAASSNVEREDPPVVRAALPRPTTMGNLPIGDDAQFRVVTSTAHTATGTYFVIVAQSLDPVSDEIQRVAQLLVIGAPALLAIVAVVTWFATGRALRPVDAMRTKAETISATNLGDRLPVSSAEDEVTRLGRTLNSMLARLDAARRREQQFVSDASHELRSPLATILHRVDAAKAHPDRTDTQRLLEAVWAEGQRLNSLIDGLLSLARADEQPYPAALLRLPPVDLDEVMLSEARRIRDHGRVSVTATEVTGARVPGDVGALTRVVRNLADNAERYAFSRVTFMLCVDDGTAVLTVADDGPGVALEQRERIFERFVRVDPSRARSTGGTGLGLAIVRASVARHGGTVTVSDSAEGGASFVVRLPTGPGGPR